MTIEEITTSFKAALYERITSPLAGTFVFSWCIYNYKFLLVLISNEAVEEKFKIIENTLYVDPTATRTQLIIYPLLSTFFLIAIYPLFSLMAYTCSLWWKKWLRITKNNSENATLLTRKESRELRNKVYEMDAEMSEKTKELNAANEHIRILQGQVSSGNEAKEELSALKYELEQKEKTKEYTVPNLENGIEANDDKPSDSLDVPSSEEAKENSIGLDSNALAILDIMARNQKHFSEDSIKHRTNMNTKEIRIAFAELKEGAYIDFDDYYDETPFYNISNKGLLAVKNYISPEEAA